MYFQDGIMKKKNPTNVYEVQVTSKAAQNCTYKTVKQELWLHYTAGYFGSYPLTHLSSFILRVVSSVISAVLVFGLKLQS